MQALFLTVRRKARTLARGARFVETGRRLLLESLEERRLLSAAGDMAAFGAICGAEAISPYDEAPLPAVGTCVECRIGRDGPATGQNPPVTTIPDAEMGPSRAYPSSYDLRTLGMVTPVRDQLASGTCWAFAAYASLESAVLREGDAPPDFSENNMANYHGFDYTKDQGGNFYMGQAYLSRGDGPVAEADDPYSPIDDSQDPPPVLPVQGYVRETTVFDTTDEMKWALQNVGALDVGLYWDDAYFDEANNTYYYSGPLTDPDTGDPVWPNHDIAIIGWDDTIATAGGTGAWLFKNSHGTDFGDSGYGWLSYNDPLREESAASFHDMAPADSVDAIYYHDHFGYVWDFNMPWAMNAFTATGSQAIDAVQFWTLEDNAQYSIYVYDTFSGGSLSGLLGEASGTMAHWGSHTADLAAPVYVDSGDDFYVAVQITDGGAYPTAIDSYDDGYTSTSTASPGESFYSWSGTSWTDLTTFDPTGNFCIKVLADTVEPEIVVDFGSVTIVDGDTTPSTAEGTDFGSVVQGGPAVSRTFRVSNTGDGELTTSGLTVPSGYAIAEGLSAVIAPGGYDDFTVALETTAPGAFTGDITFTSNDADEAAYNFQVTGTVTAPAADQVYVLGEDASNDDYVFPFDHDGTANAALEMTGNRRAIAENGDGSLYVATGFDVDKFSTDGAFQQTFATVSSVSGWVGTIRAMEFGSNGNLYVTPSGDHSNPRKCAAFDESGTPIATFEHSSLVFPDGIDVDASGYVWIANSAAVGVGNELFKFTASGAFAGQYDLDAQGGNPGDMAIDEAGERLFLADFLYGGLQVYDIASGSPVFVKRIATGLSMVTGIEYDAGTGHLFVVGYAGTAWEVDPTTGATLNTYPSSAASPPVDNGTDIVFIGGAIPDIHLQGGGQDILDGDTTPDTNDHTDFGAAEVASGAVSHSFTIQNTGGAELNLTTLPLVEIIGAHASDFTVTSQPTSSSVAPGGAQTFVVQFAPTAPGLRTATVQIASDDPDEAPYHFAIQGTGNATPGTIHGAKWHDLDADGTWDAIEPGLEGWIIYVDLDDNGQLDTGEPSAVTAFDGSYSISSIASGTWNVREVAQPGWNQTYPIDAHPITISSGQTLTDIDFGNASPLHITSAAPDADGPVEYIDVTFSGPIDPSTFTPDDVSILPDAGFDIERAGYDGGYYHDAVVVGEYAYVATANGLEVLDVSAPEAPLSIGTCDLMDSARGVTVAGSYAYIANDEAGLQIIDISSPASPTRVGGCDTSGIARSVTVAGSYAYVADDSAGLQIIDISSPASPTWVGGCDTSSTTRDVTVAGSYAYVADDFAGLHIIDISNPASPIGVGWYNTSGCALGVAVVGSYAYVADESAGLQIIDISSPTSPSRVGGYDTASWAYGVAVVGSYAYVADGTGGLQIINISNPATPIRVGGYDTSRLAADVSVVGNYAYVADGGLQIIDISDPTSPTLSGGVDDTLCAAHGVTVVGSYAYVADESAGLQIVDISNPTSPTQVGGCDTSSWAHDVTVVGSYAYVADHSAGLQIIDISNPTNPTRVGAYDTPGSARGVTVVGSYAYVADYSAGLQIIDISSPTSPTRVGAYDTPGWAWGVAVVGSYAYVADYSAGLQIIDISNPTNPTLSGGYDTWGSARGVAVVGSYAYVADSRAGLQIIDISSPASPALSGGEYDTSSQAYGVAVVGSYAYLADYKAGLQIIDISNPTSPTRVGGRDTSGALGVAVDGNYAYVADEGAGLQILELPTGVDSVESLGGQAYRIHLSEPLELGDYTLRVGPYVENVAGVSMDQDQDGTPGEQPDDIFTFVLTVADTTPPTVDIVDVTPDPREDAADSITIAFSEPVTGFDLADLALTRDGGADLLAGSGATLTTADNQTWTLGNLSSLTATPGDYELLLTAAGSAIEDAAANVLAGDATEQWTVTPPPPLHILSAAPDSEGPTEYIDVTFSGPIDPSTFTPDDVSILPDAGYSLQFEGFYGGQFNDVTLVGDYVYAAKGSGLQIFEYSALGSLIAVGQLALPDSARDVTVLGDLALVAASGSGLQIVDVSNPAAPVVVGAYDTPGYAYGVAAAGDRAYIADQDSGLQIIDISDPTAPLLVDTYDTPGYAYGVTVVGNRIYIADGGSGLQIVDVSAQGLLVPRGSFNTPGTAYDVVVSGQTAYVADQYGGLQIIDVSDPSAPALVGEERSSTYAHDIAVAGDYAYVADEVMGVRVVDISDPAAPAVLNRYATAGYAFGVATADDLTFVADGPHGLVVVDVSDPANPEAIDDFATLGRAKQVAASGDFAFVADGHSGLQIVDISDPASPTVAGAFDVLGSAEDVAIVGDLAYVAADSAGLQILDVSDPAAPTLVGSLDRSRLFSPSGYVDDEAQCVQVAGDLAYVGDMRDGFEIVDVSDPAAPVTVGRYNTPGHTWDIEIVGDLAFLADFGEGLEILDVSEPASPTRIGYFQAGHATGVAVSGDVAYVTSLLSGLFVIDISNPSSPALLGQYHTDGYAYDVAVRGGLAYIGNQSLGVQVVDVSDPYLPFFVGNYNTPGYAYGVTIADGLVYVADNAAGLQMLELPDAAESITPISGDTYRIALHAPLAPGGYTLRVGPNVANGAGVVMDQDQDGTPGEQPDDIFQFAITVDEPPTTLFVDDDAATGGDGLAWATAFDSLQDALAAAEVTNTDAIAWNDISEIWIAEGTYTPGTSRTDTFSLLDTVDLYGRFTGDETDIETRHGNETILSGDIGVVGDRTDNSYTVVVACSLAEGVTLDGLTIAEAHGGVTGGGLNILGGNLTLRDFWIRDCSSVYGGAIHASGGARVTAEVAAIVRNEATASGGAVFAEGTGTRVEFRVSHAPSQMIDNAAAIYGGAALAVNGATVRLEDTIIDALGVSGDMAMAGGALAAYRGGRLEVVDSRIVECEAPVGGAIYVSRSESSVSLAGVSEVFGNISHIGGGLFITGGGAATINGATFRGNRATNRGGAIAVDGAGSTLDMTNTDLTDNRAAALGGGLYLGFDVTATVSGGTISGAGLVIGHRSAFLGGGIAVERGGHAALTGTSITANRAYYGGGLFVRDNTSTVSLSGASLCTNTAARLGSQVFQAFDLAIAADATTTIEEDDPSDIRGAIDWLDAAPQWLDGTEHDLDDMDDDKDNPVSSAHLDLVYAELGQ